MADNDFRPMLEKLQESIDGVGTKVTAQGRRLDGIDGKLDGLEKSVDVLAKHLSPLPGQVTALSSRVQSVEKELKSFRAETEANFAGVHDRLDTVEETTRRHERELGLPRRRPKTA